MASGPAQAQKPPIKIGLLAPVTGPLASPGAEMVNGFRLFWDQANLTAGGRKIEIVVGDTGCNPDQAMSQARRLVLQEKVNFLVGPLCGHEGPAVAQVSRETGIPVVMDSAGADNITKWERTPTVVRTAVSASQIAHPFGEYLYKELGLRNVTFIGQDYTFGQEVTLGAIKTFTDAGGKVARLIWNPIGTKDYGTTINSIPADSDGVAVMAVGADRIRLFEDWFNFGMDKKHKLYGMYWLQEDMLPQIDDRAVGLVSNSLHYVSGIDTPENKAFVDAYATKYKRLPSWFAESAYTAGLWVKTAVDKIDGDVENRDAFLKAVRSVQIKAPRGPLRLDEYDNPIQNVYISKVEKVKHPILGDTLVNKPIKTYEAVSQFWTWKPEEFLARGPYKR
ncbi:MAG: ABC transporter substrate-binding protein [Candidatus Afipia apatlaquensis]|uniref:ABC transporter substrate-binding protein n=1 Tax=Candidatus Afipia apatlaquensis TaxID=2712852 RepID=A0A7C9RJM1_9BRAD|nr:ABC transporter substrate-binding protein [Candidatus Afipia apatlaquensis]